MNIKKIIVISFLLIYTVPIASHLPAIGIQNQGNTCFMNAVLQSLYHSQGLTALLNNIALNNPNFYKPQSVAREYLTFLNMYKDTLYTAKTAISPIEWCTKIWSLELSTGEKKFETKRTGDANDFLQVTLGHLGLDSAISDINEDFITERLPFPLQALPNNELTNMLLSITKSYSKGHLSSVNSMSSMTVDIVTKFDANKPVSFVKNLDEAIVNYLNQPKESKKQKFFKLPTYLPISMKRFTPYYTQDQFGNLHVHTKKVYQNIPFPLEFDFAEFLDDNGPKQKSIYQLYAVVLHWREAFHYSALVKIDNTWYDCNDERADKNYKDDRINIPAEEKVQMLANSISNHEDPTPYILFYKLKSDNSEPLSYKTFSPDKIIQASFLMIQEQLRTFVEQLKIAIDENRKALDNPIEAAKLLKRKNENKFYPVKNQYNAKVRENQTYRRTVKKIEKELLAENFDFSQYFQDYLTYKQVTDEEIKKSIEIGLIDQYYLASECSVFIVDKIKANMRTIVNEQATLKIIARKKDNLEALSITLNSLAITANKTNL